MLFNPHSLDWLGDHCRPAILVFFLILFLAPMCLSAEPVLPVLTTDTRLATAGYYQLSWQPGMRGASHKNSQFELQQSNSANFHIAKLIYCGPDRASVISGLTDGDYYYRVRLIHADQSTSGWSRPVVVKVQHHPLKKALGYFITGALVFIITLMFIVVKSRRMDEI